MYFRDKHASNATDVAYHIYKTTGFDRQLKIYLICCILHVCKNCYFFGCCRKQFIFIMIYRSGMGTLSGSHDNDELFQKMIYIWISMLINQLSFFFLESGMREWTVLLKEVTWLPLIMIQTDSEVWTMTVRFSWIKICLL